MRKHLQLIILSFLLYLFAPVWLFAQQGQTYESAIESGEEMLSKKEYISAKTYFEIALRLREEDAYATKKLNETLQLLREEMELQEAFFQKMDLGDRLFEQQKLEDALEAYNQALEFIPTDNYTLNQVEKITDTLREQKERIDGYNQSMELGESLLEQGRYEPALFQFEKAKSLFPERELPVEKIEKTQQLLAAQIAHENQFDALLEEASASTARKDYATAIEKYEQALLLFPEDAGTIQKLNETQALRDKAIRYEEALGKADKLYTEQSFSDALSFYQQALDIWPEQPYPADMLNRINTLLNDAEFLNQQAFNELLAQANLQYDGEQFDMALESYKQAFELKPSDEFTQSRIDELTALFDEQSRLEELEAAYAEAMEAGESALNLQNYEDAIIALNLAITLKPDEIRPKTLLQEAEAAYAALNQQEENIALYQTTIEAADKLMEEQAWEDARLLYVKAAALPLDVAYPLAQIEQIDKLIGEQQAAEAMQLAYTNHINEADAAFDADQLHEARIAYVEAFNVKPSETYPQDRIGEIDQMLAQRNADAEAQALENEFSQLIAQARKAFEEDRLEAALDNFIKALELKPQEDGPKASISEIEALMAQKQLDQQAESNYQALIQQANQQFEDEALEQAKSTYAEALLLFPERSYPAEQISAIEALLDEMKALADRKKRIDELIALGDNFLETGQLDEADTAFNQVLDIEPGQLYASSKLTQIQALKEEAFRQNQAKYVEFMAAGDQYLNEKDYREAVVAYKTARGYLPDDATANQKIVQAENLLREQQMAIMTEYNKFITEADRQYNVNAYDRAIEAYTKAERVNPQDTYPREMIKKIAQIIEDNKLVEVNLEPVQVLANTSKRFTFSPVNVIERRTNYIIIKAKNMGETEFPLIFSYGSENGRNGGFVLPIPADTDYQDYIVRIGSQYKWFSEDNDWFSVTPENGNIEVGLVQISRGN
jgi:tetratricopeptide (TPR) repeat protein